MKTEYLNFDRDFYYELQDYSVISVLGDDRESFLNGQLTCSMSHILPHSSNQFSRLDVKGRIKYYGQVARLEDSFAIYVKESFAEELIDDLNKYIISEDVELRLESNLQIYFSSIPANVDSVSCINQFTPGFLNTFKSESTESLKYADTSFSDFLFSTPKGLFPETILCINSNHSSKGCYVGQEIVSKIENNRGARKFPLLLKISRLNDLNLKSAEILISGSEFGKVEESYIVEDELCYLLVRAKREHNFNCKNLSLEINGREFLAESISLKDYAQNIFKSASNDKFIQGVDLLNEEKSSFAERFFSLSLLLNSQNLDSLEAIGVLYGRNKNFKLAHKIMDQLIALDPSNVMAHTNKSLFFMNEGKIDDAEKEKELALNKTLENKSGSRTNIETQKDEYILKLEKQLRMYSEVMDLDPEDEFASEKWLEVNFKLKNYNQIISFLDQRHTYNKVLSFVWRIKIAEELGTDKTTLIKDAPSMVSEALKMGDSKSAEILNRFISS